MMTRQRADRLLVERGLFESRAKAQAAIEAGLVRANDAMVRKPSEVIATDAILQASAAHPYVSRAGVKLAAALDHFDFDPKDRTCLDVGASTGGFTQVLLERGAKRVIAVDVGHGQLHPSLSARPDVLALEGTDIRTLSPAQLGEPPDLVVVDVSFISLKLVLPALGALLRRPAQFVALIKPQFEAGRKHLKKGIVRDPAVHAAVCDDIAARVRSLG
ncbi:MAG TPA: TlyA family RNA methyltransferase, partial [Pseudolabrys sp.]|nr:TlyA family RNA methyltransferase [Pseudolabrys sp.]